MRVQRKVQQLSFGAGAPSDKITPVMDFLKENYQIEVNRYDPNQIRIRSLKKNYRFPVSLDDISIHMMQFGIQHTRSMIRMLLLSPNQMKTYDPITEYFDRVGKLEITESHIDKLIAHLRVREFGDRPEGEYQKRGVLYPQMARRCGGLRDGTYANEVALVFVSETEGNGKTTLARFLCPPALSEMLVASRRDKTVFDLEQAMVRNFFILYDEMYGLTSSSAEGFKTVMSAGQLAVRFKGELCSVPRRRIASVIGTTNNRMGNNSGFLYPAIGTRRFICIHLDSIDFDYMGGRRYRPGLGRSDPTEPASRLQLPSDAGRLRRPGRSESAIHRRHAGQQFTSTGVHAAGRNRSGFGAMDDDDGNHQ